jgi:hypothetical protein
LFVILKHPRRGVLKNLLLNFIQVFVGSGVLRTNGVPTGGWHPKMAETDDKHSFLSRPTDTMSPAKSFMDKKITFW